LGQQDDRENHEQRSENQASDLPETLGIASRDLTRMTVHEHLKGPSTKVVSNQTGTRMCLKVSLV